MESRLQKYKSLREEIAKMPDELFDTHGKRKTIIVQSDENHSISYKDLMDVYADNDSRKHKLLPFKQDIIWRIIVISVVIILIVALILIGIWVFRR
ncbi:MAG: hypothetical protein WC366_01400 [Bacilli bacterium]|jgi:ABC-type multidrug transport system fused ATPase/permease subunit